MRSYALLAATCVSLCAVSMAVPLSSVTAAQRIELSMWGKLETKLISQNREPNEETQRQDVQWVNRAKFEKPAKSSEHICILTSYSRNCAKLKPLTYQNKFDYAKKHGYSFRVYSEDNSMMANPHEDKFALLLKELDSGCDWVFWSDADSYFQNFDIPLAAFTNGETAEMIFSWMTFSGRGLQDQVPWIEKMAKRPLEDRRLHQLNSGQFFVKNTPWVKKFIKDSWKNTQSKRKVIHAWNDQGNIADMILQLDDESLKKIAFYSFRAFNSHYALEQAAGMGSHFKDLLIHVPGSCRVEAFHTHLCYAMLSYKAPSTDRKAAKACASPITTQERRTALHFHPET